MMNRTKKNKGTKKILILKEILKLKVKQILKLMQILKQKLSLKQMILPYHESEEELIVAQTAPNFIRQKLRERTRPCQDTQLDSTFPRETFPIFTGAGYSSKHGP